jgi:hypothetical protein
MLGFEYDFTFPTSLSAHAYAARDPLL